MSDPSRLYICQSATFHTNKRKLDLEEEIDRHIRVKLPPRVAANFLPPYLWCYASQNQQDGNFKGYSTRDFHRIFAGFGFDVSLRITAKLISAMRRVGFIDPEGRLHSWRKYNEFFSTARHRLAARERWRKERAKQREIERKESETKAKAETEAKAKTNGNGGAEKISKQLWAVKSQLENAPRGSQERKKLLKLKRELERQMTGVGSDEPQPMRHRPPEEPKKSQQEIDREFLSMARVCMKDTPDALTERMFLALYNAGEDHLPPAIKKKFAKLLEQLGTEARNPVPG